jgi:hypothetical protein
LQAIGLSTGARMGGLGAGEGSGGGPRIGGKGAGLIWNSA